MGTPCRTGQFIRPIRKHSCQDDYLAFVEALAQVQLLVLKRLIWEGAAHYASHMLKGRAYPHHHCLAALLP
jgi:hypothetical protein